MNSLVLSEALALTAKATAAGCIGSVENAAEWERLNADFGGVVPQWYVELITTVPLVGLTLRWQASGLGADEEDAEWIEWFDASNVRLEALELHPGKSILKCGYYCVAGGNGTGDQHFLSARDGDDPPLYRIDHETNEDADEIPTRGREVIAASLSQLFRGAWLQADIIP